MLTTLLYLKIALAFFMMIMMYVEWKRGTSFKAKILFMIFAAFLLKEAVAAYYLHNWIPFAEQLKGESGMASFSGDYLNNLYDVSKFASWKNLQGYFDKYNIFWNIIEGLFALFFFIFIHRWANLEEKGRSRRVIFFINLLLAGGMTFVYFTYNETMPVTLILWGGVLWRTVLMLLAGIQVGKIYKYTLLDLKFLVNNKSPVIAAAIAFCLFYLIGQITDNMRSFPFAVQTLGLVILSFFAFRYQRFVMDDAEEHVVIIQNEQKLVINLLQDIGHAMAENLSQALVLERIVDSAVKSTDARAGCVLLMDQRSGQLKVEYVQGFYPPVVKMDLGGIIKEKFLVDKFKNSKVKIGESYLGEAAATGKAVFIKDALQDPRVEQTAPGLMEIRSIITVPLKIQEDILGVMSIVNKESAMFFSEADLSLMETLGDQAAITLNQVALYQEMLVKKQSEKELSVAGDIQKGLLPQSFPEFEKIEISAFSHAAKGVGGDYYDMLDFGNGKVGFICTDVAGKGVPAALVMVMIRSVLRAYARHDKEAKDVISMVNDTISGEVTEERYATMFYFIFDSEYKILNYCNAGHGPLLLYRSNLDSFAMLDTEGMPVGIAPGVEYGQEYTSLHAGDIAVLYTDGITECMNHDREQYGLDRLKACIRKNKDLPAKDLTDTIYKEMKEFAQGAPQHDDETLLLMKAK